MINLLRRFWYEEDGMGTIEIVIIIAVLVALALIFSNTITSFAEDLMKKVFNPEKVTDATDTSTNSLYNSSNG